MAELLSQLHARYKLNSQPPQHPQRAPSPGMMAVTGCAVGVLMARQLWLIATALDAPSPQPAFNTHPPVRRARLLVAGDSTGVGVGVQHAALSLAGLMGTEFTALEVVNTARSGARVRDTLAQVNTLLLSGERFDVALLFAGGNDVLRFTTPRSLHHAAISALTALKGVATCVVWMGCADMGSAPMLLPPVSWWLGWRSRRTMAWLKQVAAQQDVEFIDFCDRHHTLEFADKPALYFAADGLHPSGAAHRHCFETLKRRLHAMGIRTDAWTANSHPALAST